jgi:signal transduction histidine kinase
MKQRKEERRASASSRVEKRIQPGRIAAAARSIPSRAERRAAISDAVIKRILQSNRFLLLARLSAPMVHEIINPVSAVLNLATLMQHILKDDGVPPGQVTEFRSYLTQVISESKHAGRIASEMQSFARATSHEPRGTDLNEVIRQALSLASHMFRMEDVEFHLELADGLLGVRCDSPQLQQALLNLLVNAAEAVEGRQQRRVTVETRLHENGHAAVLEVRDTGAGIPPEHLRRIFDPFFTTKDKPESLGLGLTIAHSIVEAHGGSIEVESRPGEGVTIRVALPGGNAGEQLMKRHRDILIADDEAAMRGSLAAWLDVRMNTKHAPPRKSKRATRRSRSLNRGARKACSNLAPIAQAVCLSL